VLLPKQKRLRSSLHQAMTGEDSKGGSPRDAAKFTLQKPAQNNEKLQMLNKKLTVKKKVINTL